MSKTPTSYHQTTSYDRYAMEPHAMDWVNQPNPYKSYPDSDGVAMPEIQSFSDQDLFDPDLQSVYGAGCLASKDKRLGLEELSNIFLLCCAGASIKLTKIRGFHRPPASGFWQGMSSV